jgi:predicted metal-dependent phosphoesterase TrpH
MKEKNEKLNNKTDLHLHTNHSDGALSTEELLTRSRKNGLNCISIVDHDNVSAVGEAIPLGKQLGIEVIPGVELSTIINDYEIHILGYFIDNKNENLLEYLKFFRTERITRAKRIVEKLNKLKIPLKIESVLEQANIGSVGRPHIASALVEEGYVDTYLQAFSRYIKNGGPAFEKKYTLTPAQAIELINKSGGLSFIAHPGNLMNESLIYYLINIGIDGIEVVHPNHTPETTENLKKIASEYFLLESGGSDYHGGLKNDEHVLGKYTIPTKHVTAMKQRLYK